MSNLLKVYFKNYRTAIFNENISFFHAFSSLLSISYILLLPNILGLAVAIIFMLFNAKILINIFIKSRLCFLNRISLIVFLILDSIFIQLPGIILAAGLVCYKPIDILSLKISFNYKHVFNRIYIYVTKTILIVSKIFTDYYNSKIYFKW